MAFGALRHLGANVGGTANLSLCREHTLFHLRPLQGQGGPCLSLAGLSPLQEHFPPRASLSETLVSV